jgi:hypothetical protein
MKLALVKGPSTMELEKRLTKEYVVSFGFLVTGAGCSAPAAARLPEGPHEFNE